MGDFHIRSASGAQAITGPGYFFWYTPGLSGIAFKMYGQPTAVTDQEFTDLQLLHLTGVTADKQRIEAVPAQVPVTVQGASEQFITQTMGQVVANTNQNAVSLNGSIFTARDQVKSHVTSEANRVIAAQ